MSDKTCVLQFQADIRVLASIAGYLEAIGALPRTRGAVASFAFYTFYETLVDKGLVYPLGSVEDAQILLEQLGLRPTKRDMRVVKNLVKAINEEEPSADPISQMAIEAAKLHEQKKEN